MEPVIGSTFVLALLLFILISIYGSTLDYLLLISLIAYNQSDLISSFIRENVNPATALLCLQVSASLFVFLQLTGFIRGLKQRSSSAGAFPVKPMFFPCETKHVRIFPAKHGFSYSYLLTGVPVGFTGSAGGMLSIDEDFPSTPWYARLFRPWRPWYVISSDDYLGRGYDPEGLAGKLRKYLESEGIDPSQYGHAYFFTAARFLNYASNPVSLWHLYSKENELTAMILEVNNTFDERHIYFLKPNVTKTPSTARYSGTWPKDFYVSTFNSRSGFYSVSSSTSPLHHHKIDTTITLSDAEGKGMLIARVYSTSPPIDPTTISVLEKMRFLALWWWVGLATFPRTVVQAFNLLVHKKMPWVSRPEPRKDTSPRHADVIEICIERQFRKYLREQVEKSEQAMKIKYIPAGSIGLDSKLFEFNSRSADLNKELLEVRVLTPAFYSRLVQYTSMNEALDSEVINGTISISNPSPLQKISTKNTSKALNPIKMHKSNTISRPPTSAWDSALFTLISLLRTPPLPIPKLKDEIQPPLPSRQIVFGKKEKKDRRTSDLDAFLLSSPSISSSQRKEYAAQVLRLVIAKRIAFGWLEVLDLEIWSLKSAMIWWAIGVLL